MKTANITYLKTCSRLFNVVQTAGINAKIQKTKARSNVYTFNLSSVARCV